MWNYMEASHERSVANDNPSISVFVSSATRHEIIAGKSVSEMTSDADKHLRHKDGRRTPLAASYRLL